MFLFLIIFRMFFFINEIDFNFHDKTHTLKFIKISENVSVVNVNFLRHLTKENKKNKNANSSFIELHNIKLNNQFFIKLSHAVFHFYHFYFIPSLKHSNFIALIHKLPPPLNYN
jgi:hypothetical protein